MHAIGRSAWTTGSRVLAARAREGTEMAPEDAGLVGTPYFWTGIAAAVALWGVVMLALWL